MAVHLSAVVSTSAVPGQGGPGVGDRDGLGEFGAQCGAVTWGRQAQAGLADLSAAAKALERESAAIARRLDSTADAGALELRATARELRQGAEQLSRAAERLRDPRAALLGPSPAQLGPGETLP